MHGGGAPDVAFIINDDSDAAFAVRDKMLPGARHVNCFAHRMHASAPKHKKLKSGVGADEIMKDLVGIRNLNLQSHCAEAILLLKEKHTLQTVFSKKFQAQCLEPCNRY